MSTPRRFRPAEILILLTQMGLRRIGGLIALVLVLLWIWAAFTGDGLGKRFMLPGKLGNFTTTTYSHPR